jgi:pimeloyl-ACP methyl ester carboxylesterase
MSSTLSYEGTARTLATDAGVLSYHEAGYGRPLVLLHGLGPGVTGRRDFRNTLPALAEFFRCVILEVPDFGVSDDFGADPMLAAHDALVRFVEALRLESIGIIGNSMGASIAVDYAIRHPGKVHRLVTIGGIGRSLFNPGPTQVAERLLEFTHNPTRNKLVHWLRSMVYDPAWVTDELIAERWAHATQPDMLASARRICTKTTLGELVRDTDGESPSWMTLHQIQAPTLLTWGRDDRVTPLDMALPRCAAFQMPNCMCSRTVGTGR